MTDTHKGRFITFEGGEGTGKSTQSALLAAALAARGIEAVQTREPGGTLGAEAIRALLLNPDSEGWTAEAEALLFAAARSDHVERIIRPAIAAGQWVICDRYLDSSRAYQAGEGSLTDADVLTLHQIGAGGLLPDCTILIEVAPDVTAARLAARDGDKSDRIGGRHASYHANVARRFAKMAEADPTRFLRISGEGSAEDVHQRVLTALGQHLVGEL